ncbi:MAG: copper chaperone PCu(A)C [Alphaproteobacteria bacterium]|nr:copper chaperone PCu(A)C [Alphaproteobacteria bacterium]
MSSLSLFEHKFHQVTAGFIFFVTYLLVADGATGQTGQLEIKAPWARATLGQALNSTVYFTIVSSTTDRLTAISSPVAKKAELHTISIGGVISMRPLAAMDIPAGQTITLTPGGIHIMLQGLTRPFREGETFPLMLWFEHAGPRQVTVPVEDADAMGPRG